MHPPNEGLLSSSGIELTPFRNFLLKKTGYQVHATTPNLFLPLIREVLKQKTITENVYQSVSKVS